MSKKIDLRNLDFNNAGSWPLGLKIAFSAMLGVVLVGLAWYAFVSDQRVQLQSLERQEQTLRAEFEKKQTRAVNLEPLKQQLVQMEAMLQQMLRQLPSKTEMADFIVDISQTALASGITNELFRPGAEAPKEFYVEKPIELRMVGAFHQFGAFVSGVASLPRVVIMTMHDISLRPQPGQTSAAGANSLVLEGTIKTYRYLDEGEGEASDSSATGAR